MFKAQFYNTRNHEHKQVNMQPSHAFQHFMRNVKKKKKPGNLIKSSHQFFSHINYKVAMHAMLSSLMMTFSYRVTEEYNLVANPSTISRSPYNI